MKVELLNSPEPWLCAMAAAECTCSTNPEKALARAMESGHESVLEHCIFTFRVSGVSRTLLAQITRHRIASFSVQSQRYVKLTDGFPYVTPPSIEALGSESVKRYHAQMEMIDRWYNGWLQTLGKGGAEDARFVLPGACATSFQMTMNARELRHFFSLRCCNRAQWEIRMMADDMLRLCRRVAPELFKDAGPGCVRGSCPEGRMSCGHPRRKDCYDG